MSDEYGVSDGKTGVCSLQCSSASDQSFFVHQSQCQLQLTAGVAMTGFPGELEGWTVAHNDGLQTASDAPGISEAGKEVWSDAETCFRMKDLLRVGIVVIGNTVDYGDDFVAAAKLYPTEIPGGKRRSSLRLSRSHFELFDLATREQACMSREKSRQRSEKSDSG